MSISVRLARLRPGFLRFLRTTFGLATFAVVAAFGTVGYNFGASYYWLMAAAVVPAAVYAILRRAVPIAQARMLAKKRWKAYGPNVERVPYTQFEVYRDRYGGLTRDPRLGFVDDRTWNDLGMDEIHDRIDVCFTIAGRNELYRTLRHALPPESALADRAELMELFSTNSGERLRIAQALARIGEERDADPATLLWGDGAQPDDLYPVFIAMCVFSVAAIVTTAAVDLTLGIIAIVVAFFSNMWVYYRKARHLSVHIPALRVLSRMIEAAKRLDWYALPEARRHTGGAKRAYAWLLTGAPSPSPTLSGDITEVVFLYVKMFFQIDLIAYNRIVRTIAKNEEAYRALYQGIGSIDALFALASYRARRRRTCDAELSTTAAEDPARPGNDGGGDAPASPVSDIGIHLDGAYHPLIGRAVPNTVTLDLPGAIVTGTNMAGKSTFLRMVGINVLFAQTTGYAFAKAYRAPRFRIMSSIEKHDDIEEGKSFYYDEAERIYTMIEETGTGEATLLLIDELLSGTNSLERESASVAILHYLADRKALTIAATHDVAIARGVADRYSLHYFTDSADENGLTFDYKIHDGVVQTRNAIKLLRLIGYPEDVIETALESTRGL
ncbi:MAG: MutS-related protein [Spirochaetota bacterium]